MGASTLMVAAAPLLLVAPSAKSAGVN